MAIQRAPLAPISQESLKRIEDARKKQVQARKFYQNTWRVR